MAATRREIVSTLSKVWNWFSALGNWSDAGADDYVTKPFSMKVLTARLRAAIRRAQLPKLKSNAVIAIGAIELHRSGDMGTRRQGS